MKIAIQSWEYITDVSGWAVTQQQ